MVDQKTKRLLIIFALIGILSLMNIAVTVSGAKIESKSTLFSINRGDIHEDGTSVPLGTFFDLDKGDRLDYNITNLENSTSDIKFTINHLDQSKRVEPGQTILATYIYEYGPNDNSEFSIRLYSMSNSSGTAYINYTLTLTRTGSIFSNLDTNYFVVFTSAIITLVAIRLSTKRYIS